jgi:TPP-dependent pyruvate/acetoin dehydrogenase alpha subunit
MHFGAPERGIFPLVSMLGDLVPVTVGAALAFKRRGLPQVAMTFFGDGAMSTGDVHEGLNLAGVLKVPAVFIIQSNQFAYSTPTARQMVNTNIADRIQRGWSIPCERVDGTDALLVHDRVRAAIERARGGDGPQAVECITLRVHGHAAHDHALYVPDELRRCFADPIERLEQHLDAEEAQEVRTTVEQEVASGLAESQAAPPPDPRTITDGVYAR